MLLWNIKIDLQDMGCWGLDGIELAQGQVAGTCKCGNENSGCKKPVNFLTSCKPFSFSGTLFYGESEWVIKYVSK